MTTEITFWAIRHIPTGHYLPQPLGRMRRGGSHVEPVKHMVGEPSTEPRLFTTKRSASSALGQWMRGKAFASRGMSSGHPGNDWESDYYEDIEVIPQPHRVREDMEIIPINLVIP